MARTWVAGSAPGWAKAGAARSAANSGAALNREVMVHHQQRAGEDSFALAAGALADVKCACARDALWSRCDAFSSRPSGRSWPGRQPGRRCGGADCVQPRPGRGDGGHADERPAWHAAHGRPEGRSVLRPGPGSRQDPTLGHRLRPSLRRPVRRRRRLARAVARLAVGVRQRRATACEGGVAAFFRAQPARTTSQIDRLTRALRARRAA